MPTGPDDDDEDDRDPERRRFRGVDKGKGISIDDYGGGLKAKGKGVAADDYGEVDNDGGLLAFDGMGKGKGKGVVIDDDGGGQKGKGKRVGTDDYGAGDAVSDQNGKRKGISMAETLDMSKSVLIVEDNSETGNLGFERQTYSYDQRELIRSKPSICMESFSTSEEYKRMDGEWQLAPNQIPEQPLPSNLNSTIGFKIPQPLDSLLLGRSADGVGAKRCEQLQPTHLRFQGISSSGHEQHREHSNPQSSSQPYRHKLLPYSSNTGGFKIHQSRGSQLSGHLVGEIGAKRGDQLQLTYLRSRSQRQLPSSLSDTVGFKVPQSRDSTLLGRSVNMLGPKRGKQFQSTNLRSWSNRQLKSSLSTAVGFKIPQSRDKVLSRCLVDAIGANRGEKFQLTYLRSRSHQQLPSYSSPTVGFKIPQSRESQLSGRSVDMLGVKRGDQLKSTYVRSLSHQQLPSHSSPTLGFKTPQPRDSQLSGQLVDMLGAKRREQLKSTYLRSRSHQQLPSHSSPTVGFKISQSRDSQLSGRSVDVLGAKRGVRLKSTYLRSQGTSLTGREQDHVHRRQRLHQGQKVPLLAQLPGRYHLKASEHLVDKEHLGSWLNSCIEWFDQSYKHEDKLLEKQARSDEQQNLSTSQQSCQSEPLLLPEWMTFGHPQQLMSSPHSGQAASELRHGDQLHTMQPLCSVEEQKLDPSPSVLSGLSQSLLPPKKRLFPGHPRRVVIPHSRQAVKDLRHGDQLHALLPLCSTEQQNLGPSPPAMQSGEVNSLSSSSSDLSQPMASPDSGEATGPLLSSKPHNLDILPATETEQQFKDIDEQE